MTVTFTPTSEGALIYKMGFRLNSNPQKKSLTCRGEGKSSDCPSPPQLSMEPMKPFEPPRVAVVAARNECDYAIEMFSLDFDDQYLEEEETCARRSYDEHGC